MPAETLPPNSSDDSKKTRPRRKLRLRFILLTLVMLVALAAFAYWYLILHSGKFSLSSLTKLTALRNTIESSTTVRPHETKPTASNLGGHAAKPAPLVTPPRAPASSVQVPLGSQQAAQLMAAIHQLQTQLQQMYNDNEQLRRALGKQQRLDLRSRLRLIADPATNLEQLALLWQDVSLSPVISANQRSEAISMTAAARDALTQNRQWQQRLDLWIARLSEPGSGQDLVPHFSQSWLEWLTRQFHLRPAPTNNNGNQKLRQKLIGIRNGMTVESWPEAKEWRPVRAELVLINVSSAKHNGKSTALGLPSDFTTIRKAVATLHATAAQWLGTNP